MNLPTSRVITLRIASPGVLPLTKKTSLIGSNTKSRV
jgi:hypothetical protein